MLDLIGLAAAIASTLHAPPNSSGVSPANPVIVPIETGWLRSFDGRAMDESPTCYADAEGPAFERLSASLCPPNSRAARRRQLAKLQAVILKRIITVAIGDEPFMEAPEPSSEPLSAETVTVEIAPSGAVQSCRHLDGRREELCAGFARGDYRTPTFAGEAPRVARIRYRFGMCLPISARSVCPGINDPRREIRP